MFSSVVLVTFALACLCVVVAMVVWCCLAIVSPRPEYSYGVTSNGTRVRVDHAAGTVEFVLWKAGQQGYKEDYWHQMGPGHTVYVDGITVVTTGKGSPWA